MKVKEEWLRNEKEKEERNEAMEEMWQHSKEGEFETLEQRDSDLEDYKSDAAQQLEDLKQELKEVKFEKERLEQQIIVLNRKFDHFKEGK